MPKTLKEHSIRWPSTAGGFGETASAILRHIAEQPIPPELVPGMSNGPAQSVEAEMGPYAVRDFFLHYASRIGFRPAKVAFLAAAARSDAARSSWRDTVPSTRQTACGIPTIKKWLAVSLYRFFEFSQFKRSALPKGLKVGSGGSLSPCGNSLAPSDAIAEARLEELHESAPNLTQGVDRR